MGEAVSLSQSHRSEKALSGAPVGPLMFKLALPAVAAQLINMLYNIADRIYIGHIPEVGRTAPRTDGFFARGWTSFKKQI